MKILVAPDKFKGSLSALQVCDAVAEGIFLVNPNIEVIKSPLADGGDGTARILTYHSNGTRKNKTVCDPLFRKTQAAYGISGDGSTAFIEIAAASGLNLLKNEERNCLLTTSYGTGELILDAIQSGVKKIILGIGGSATNDCGMGIGSALGYKFLDKDGKSLSPIGQNLQYVYQIDDGNLLFEPGTIDIKIACDVDNPLYGQQGAAHVFALQKGANEQAIQILDEGLKNINSVFIKKFHIDANTQPGAGAAGGVGAAGFVLLKAQLVPGVTLVTDQINFQELVKKADLIITGEGKIDSQTLRGKVIKGVSDIARKFHVPVVAICGAMEADTTIIKELKLDFAASVINKPMDLEEAIAHARENVKQLAFNIVNFCEAIKKR